MLERHTISFETFKKVAGLFLLFGGVLGVSSLVFVPQGVTYETDPLIHTIWLLFGIIIVGRVAARLVNEIHFSTKSIFVVLAVIILGLASSVTEGHLVARAVKILEIIFQDLVIATTLVTLGKHLSNQTTERLLSIGFALMHVPLFFVEPFTHVLAIVVGALCISYVSIVLFLKNNKDIGMIIIPHVAFYLLFGTALSIVFW